MFMCHFALTLYVISYSTKNLICVGCEDNRPGIPFFFFFLNRQILDDKLKPPYSDPNVKVVFTACKRFSLCLFKTLRFQSCWCLKKHMVDSASRSRLIPLSHVMRAQRPAAHIIKLSLISFPFRSRNADKILLVSSA